MKIRAVFINFKIRLVFLKLNPTSYNMIAVARYFENITLNAKAVKRLSIRLGA